MMPLPPKDAAKPWEAIDIFLFSNGQQYSPPRKYHLRNEELEWWDATLTYLGRAHYGSLHSTIEIYTINGTKVQNPMELSNGAAYVAVVPPDAFLSAGYEKYLVKASRSWEKSLQKRAAESIQTSKADVKQLVEEVTNGKHQMETPLPHAGSPGNLTANPQDRKRSSSGGRSSFFNRRNSSNSKPPETKKKPSNIPTPQATQNKNNLNTRTCTDPKRSSFKRKESDDKNSKQIISGVLKPIKNATITNVSEVITKSPIKSKDLQMQNIENETTDKNVTGSDKDVIFYRNLEKDELSSHFDVIDQVPVTSDAELNRTVSQTRLVKISEESLKTEDVFKNVIKHVVERVFTFKSKTGLDKPPNQVVNKEYTLDVIDTSICPSSCNRNSDSDKSADNTVTIIQKGDTINLKVNIEVINTEAGKSPAGDSNLNKPQPSLQGKKEAESGTGVNEDFKKSPTLKPKHYNQRLCVGTKPSQVVVVQCACTYKDPPTAFTELHASNNTSKHWGENNIKYILVPEDVLKQYQCCSCAQKITDQPAQREEHSKRPEETTGDQDQTLVCFSSIKITTSTTSTQTQTQTNTERVHCNEQAVKVAEHKEVKLDEEIMLTRTLSVTAPVVVTEDPHFKSFFSAQTDSFLKHFDHHDIKSCKKPETVVDETKKVHKDKILVEPNVEAPDKRGTLRNTDQNHVEPTRNEPEYVITKTYFDPSRTRREYIVTKRDLPEDTSTTAKQKPSYIVKRQEDPEMLPKDGHKTEFLVLRKQQPKDSVDVSTQTDWCDTLLQTRVHEDGHYSFYLPTLQLLREYKL